LLRIFELCTKATADVEANLGCAQSGHESSSLPRNFSTGYSESFEDSEPDRRRDLRVPPTEPRLIVSLLPYCDSIDVSNRSAGFYEAIWLCNTVPR
jgi:hypothetical protein